MSQAAQQDHLYVDDPGTIAGLQQGTKNILKRCCEQHTILDVVLRHKEGDNTINVSKVIGYERNVTNPKKPTHKVYFLNTSTGAIHTLSLDAL